MINIPDDVRSILEKLNNNGYDGYIVGGAVRDSLLGRKPKDWDITTNALPKVVESLFEYTIPTGKEYGTITVMLHREPYEITTYRLESDYDGRRPKAVKFAETLKEDLSRRDFTINAMAMSLDGEITDYFNGKTHLECGEIHCVGNAKDRFGEDKLRALRAIRFASRYNFEIYRDILYAMDNLSIAELSAERVREEFNKILVSNRPSDYLRLLDQVGLLNQIVPELVATKGFDQKNPHHDKFVFDHILSVINAVEPKLELRLSALFHDIGKPETFEIGEDGVGHFYQHHKVSADMCRKTMRRLKYSNAEIEYVSELVYHHMTRHNKFKKKTIKKFITKVGEDKLQDLFKLQLADIVGSKPPFNFEDVIRLRIECENILNSEEPMTVRDLDINGNDIMELGFVGKEIGQVLNFLLETVLEEPDVNEKTVLESLVNKIDWIK